jgi:hypothetical protein
VKRLIAEILTSDLENIEHDVDGRGGEGFTSPMPEPLESGDELFIEDCYFSIQSQSGLW